MSIFGTDATHLPGRTGLPPPILSATRRRDTEQQQEKFNAHAHDKHASADRRRKRTEIVRRLTAVTASLLIRGCIAATGASAVSAPVAGIQSPPQTEAGHPGGPCRTADPQTGLAPILKNTMTGKPHRLLVHRHPQRSPDQTQRRHPGDRHRTLRGMPGPQPRLLVHPPRTTRNPRPDLRLRGEASTTTDGNSADNASTRFCPEPATSKEPTAKSTSPTTSPTEPPTTKAKSRSPTTPARHASPRPRTEQPGQSADRRGRRECACQRLLFRGHPTGRCPDEVRQPTWSACGRALH